MITVDGNIVSATGENGFDLTATTPQRCRPRSIYQYIYMNSLHYKTCCESYFRYTDLSAMQQLL